MDLSVDRPTDRLIAKGRDLGEIVEAPSRATQVRPYYHRLSEGAARAASESCECYITQRSIYLYIYIHTYIHTTIMGFGPKKTIPIMVWVT